MGKCTDVLWRKTRSAEHPCFVMQRVHAFRRRLPAVPISTTMIGRGRAISQ